jgi:hypothetical protein
MKAVVLLSKTFFPKHPKAGQETHFKEGVICGTCNTLPCRDVDDVGCKDWGCNSFIPKIHTCRVNYGYWERKIARLKEVGGALSVRQWSGLPYRSPQEAVVDIPAENVSVQRLRFDKNREGEISLNFFSINGRGRYVELEDLAGNDGLSVEDFKCWLRGYDLSQDMAIIHFTKFRY